MARKRKQKKQRKQKKKPLKIIERRKSYILTGLLIVIPVALTYFVLSFVINMVDRWMAPVVSKIILWTHAPLPEDFRLPGLGFFIIGMIIFFAGLVVSNFLGRRMLQLWTNFVEQIPFVRTIYLGIKKLVDTISETDSVSFERMVIVDFPYAKPKALGLVCCDTKGELAYSVESTDGQKFVNVFVPSTPNVTTGFLMFMPVDQTRPMQMSVDEGFKRLLSFGVINEGKPKKGEDKPETRPRRN